MKARKGAYDYAEWGPKAAPTSLAALEIGRGPSRLSSGIENIRRLESPCVFIANHMSMLETNRFCRPSIQPIRNVHLCRQAEPARLSRLSPCHAFHAIRLPLAATILARISRRSWKGGLERLNKGISIIVFPQTTRSSTFDREQFNSIGVKLAARAKAPVVPTALLTDAWANGKWMKDLGPIDPKKKVYFQFAEPLEIQGRGGEEQERIVEFIEDRLNHWRSNGAP